MAEYEVVFVFCERCCEDRVGYQEVGTHRVTCGDCGYEFEWYVDEMRDEQPDNLGLV